MNNDLIRCSQCNKPLAKVKAGCVVFAKPSKGGIQKVEISIKHEKGGSFAIKCDCGSGSFRRAQKTLGMTYAVVTKNNVVDKTV